MAQSGIRMVKCYSLISAPVVPSCSVPPASPGPPSFLIIRVYVDTQDPIKHKKTRKITMHVIENFVDSSYYR